MRRAIGTSPITRIELFLDGRSGLKFVSRNLFLSFTHSHDRQELILPTGVGQINTTLTQSGRELRDTHATF